MGISTEGIRQRAIAAYEAKEGTQAQIAGMYRVSLRTFQRWLRQYRKTGSCAPGQRGHRHAAFEGQSLQRLDQLVAQHPDATLEQLRESTGKPCSIMAVQRALRKLDWRFKKSRYVRANEDAGTS